MVLGDNFMKNSFKILKNMNFNLNKNNKHPYFKNSFELLKWNQDQAIKNTIDLIKLNRKNKIENSLKSSGIKSLHINCTFDNYHVECEGQQIALNRSREYVLEFENSISNFIFSGRPGTGKNHLTSAMGKELIFKGKSFLIITISDLMSNIKNTFVNNISEESLINKLSSVDLLVIDEIGVQIESKYEKIIMNQIIDRRSSSKLKTGLLSNLDIIGMSNLLGERVIDRMRLGKGFWVCFTWNSYRARI